MKKQLLSIIALLLCFCTVFVFAACGKNNKENEGSDSGSDNAGPNSSDISGELDIDIPDVDPATAEDIFAQMKADYKATMAHTGAYSIDIEWIENQTDSESGKGASETTSKYISKESHNADPATGNASAVYLNEEYANNTRLASTTQTRKLYSEGGKNYIFSSTVSDGQSAGDTYNALTSYGVAAEKDAMLIANLINAKGDFSESFGDPFTASSASDLKSIHTSVINEIKANQKALYESNGYTVKQLTASSDIIFNKSGNTNIFKRTITVISSLQNDGGTYQKNLTVESLLKTENGKLLSFVSASTQSTLENLGESYSHQTNSTSELKYTFNYAMGTKAYNDIKTSTPATVTTAPDYFEAPVTFVINGNEVVMSIIGEADATNTPAAILDKTISDLFADTNIEYDGKWYTDAACTKEFNSSSITSIDKLKTMGRLYNSSFSVNGNYALFIDSGKLTVNIPTEYKIVFGNQISESVLNASVSVSEVTADNNITRISYMPDAGHNVTITLNKKALTGEDFLEDSDGSAFYEFMFEGGKIYFVQRSNVATKTFFTLDMFYVSF